MTQLVGAWSLRGEPVAHALPEAHRQAMASALPASPEASAEYLDARLWLRAAPALLNVRPSQGVTAAEGRLALPAGEDLHSYRTTCGDASPAHPDGHYVLAHADLAGGRLQLLRTLSGGEHLYFTEYDGLLLFAASVRALLAHPRVPDTLAPQAAEEILHCGHVVSGDATVFAAIREVLPGHLLRVGRDIEAHRWFEPWRSALGPPSGPPHQLAKQFATRLAEGVERAVGQRRPVAVALSGGIDSSAVAAAAVEVVGADAVVAYSYEFDDPRHAKETHHARAVCKALGIRDHRVFAVSFEDFLRAIPEAVWRAESPLYWPKAFLLPVARRLQADGFDQYLSGFGVGSHMAYLEHLAATLSAGPRGFGHWCTARFERRRWRTRLPIGPPVPHPRLHHPLIRYLWTLGLVKDPQALFPTPMRALLAHLEAPASPVDKPSDPDTGDRARWLRAQLQQHAMRHLLSCVDVTRSEKSSREAGACRISPAHFAGTIPYAFFPVRPELRDLPAARELRPGKYLLRLAYKGLLPDSVLYRKKSWADAVASPGWLRAGRTLMQRALPGFPGNFEALGPGYVDAIRYWEPRSIHASGLALAFCQHLLHLPVSAEPPVWESLIPGYRFGRRRRAA